MDKEYLLHKIQKNKTEEIRILLGEYQGRPLIDFRIYQYNENYRRWIPTKKGFPLKLSKENLQHLHEGIKKAAQLLNKYPARPTMANPPSAQPKRAPEPIPSVDDDCPPFLTDEELDGPFLED